MQLRHGFVIRWSPNQNQTNRLEARFFKNSATGINLLATFAYFKATSRNGYRKNIHALCFIHIAKIGSLDDKQTDSRKPTDIFNVWPSQAVVLQTKFVYSIADKICI